MSRTIAILAGGLGTRVASLTGGTTPKAMLPIAGAPFVDHKLAEAARLGADHVVLLLAHGADQLVAHVGDGARWGLDLTVVLDGPNLLGTGGALKRAAPHLGERVWVTYGDTLLDADLGAAERQAEALGCRGAMTVLHNRDQWEPSNTSIADGRVIAYVKGDPPGTHEHIDYGYVLLPADALLAVPDDAFDLGVVIQQLIARRQLAAFEVHERFHDIGTPEALAETDAWLRARAAAQS
jgi:MurNAc alpha-1-phosphate uridylyltransferase